MTDFFIDKESTEMAASVKKILNYAEGVAKKSDMESSEARAHVGTALMLASLCLAMDLSYDKDFLIGYLDQHYDAVVSLREFLF